MSEESFKNPFVLQCKECNTIVADSFSLKDYKNNILVFSSVSSTVVVDKKKILSKSLFDSDCWFNLLRCKCDKIVGKKYLTVNESCNGYAGMFCMGKEFVYSYSLGGNGVSTEVSLSEVVEDIDKLQKFCVYLYKKMEKN